MATNLNIPVPVRGELDTRNPITDRAPGTLVTARDLHPSYWGPRRGSQAFTRAWESPGTAVMYDLPYFPQTGGVTYAVGVVADEHFRDLGTKATVDVWFRLEDTSYAAAQTNIGVYSFSTGAGFINVNVRGPAHASPNKPWASIQTTPTRSTSDAAVSVEGATSVRVGTAQSDITHIRVVRDGAYAYLYVNGVLDGSTSGLVASSPIFGNIDAQGFAKVFSGSGGVAVKGTFYAAVVRDGAFTSQPIEATLPINPWARNVHVYHVGSKLLTGGANHITDLSRFKAHARTNSTDVITFSGQQTTSAPANARVQGMRSWTTRGGRTAVAVMAGGVLSVATAT